MSLSLNALLDRYKHKLLSFVGDSEFRDHLLRVQVSYQDFVLSASQMDTLNATPVSVLAAPGSGLINLPVGLFLKVNSTGFTRFELGSGVLEFRYTDGSGAQICTDITNTVVESATDILQWVQITSPLVPVSNAAIVAHASADVTAGTGNIQGRILYRTLKVSEIV